MELLKPLIVFISSHICKMMKRKRQTFKKRPLCADFYVETLTTDGTQCLTRVDARHLIEIDGELFLEGWCEELPAYRVVPVSEIVRLADDRSGLLISGENIPFWLTHRALH